MNQVVSDTVNIEALISGEVKGQVAIGSNILQIGSVHGGVVNIAMPGASTPPRPRPTPVFLRPRPFPGLLDRRDETSRVAAALRSAQPIEIDGEAGLGKTSLLRYLAHYDFDTKYPDGVVQLSLRGQSVSDVLQALFDAFYESGHPFNVKPTDVQIRYALQDKQALILFDDVDLAREELQAVIDVAPSCAFVLTSPERRLWSEGSALALAGLPLQDALNLIERELGRPLTADERPQAAALWALLEGHPLRLIQAAAIFREEQRVSALGLLQLNASAPDKALTVRLVASLSESERQIVATLAALGEVSVRAGHLANITGLSDVELILDGLVQRALLRAEGGGYRLDANLIQELQQLPDAQRWAEKALLHFLNWTEQHHDQFDRIVSEIEVLSRVLDYAAKTRHWNEALRLTTALEGALALGRRWGAWEHVLRIGLQAARELRDRPAEAWALHQIGTRALCLEHTSLARNNLIQALRLRESVDDWHGAAVTRHNLNILLGPPPSEEPPRQPSSPAALAKGVLLLSSPVLVVVVLALILIRMFVFSSFEQPPTLVPTPSATPTIISTPRPPVTATSTATSTPPATPTSTDTSTTMPTLTPSPTPCTPRYGWPIYRIQYGDTLFSIARRTGSTVYELERANCLIGDYLYAGQQLLVPRLPLVLPPTATPSPECIPQYDWPAYIVQDGDSLSSIARRTHSTPDMLRRANCLPSDYIYVGQKLFVPLLPATQPTLIPTPPDIPTPVPPAPVPTPTPASPVILNSLRPITIWGRLPTPTPTSPVIVN